MTKHQEETQPETNFVLGMKHLYGTFSAEIRVSLKFSISMEKKKLLFFFCAFTCCQATAVFLVKITLKSLDYKSLIVRHLAEQIEELWIIFCFDFFY